VLQLDRDGDVFVLRLDRDENRFRPDLLEAIGDAFDRVEKAGAPAALVTTGAGKFYSNGLDLDWLRGAGKDESADYIPSVLRLYARTLCFPAITVAAMNGHAFGAGAQWALAHDYRVMRSGRGYFCMPEIDMKAPLAAGMTALIQARLPNQTAHEMIVTGTRYPAELALERGVVDYAVPEEEVVAKAVAIAAPLAAKADPVMTRLKRDMYPRTLSILEGGMDITGEGGGLF
jgi:enoyl-CoA hydratase/carnithine racemase